MKIFLKPITSFLIFLFIALPVHANTVRTQYEIPDVREAFCGPVMQPRFCRCAFHNECGEEMDASATHSYVLSEFQEWNRQQIQRMGETCLQRDGHWDKGTWTCVRCTGGDVREGNKCITSEKVDPAVQECKEALENIDEDWEKYSDFDGRLGTDVSWEVQQFNTILSEIATMVAQAHQLEYDMEVDRQVRLSLREYKQALVMNIKTNLLKAFWRLTYVTYSTVKGAKGTADSLGKMLNPESVAEGVGAGLKVIQAHIPPNAKDYQIDTNSTTGKIKSIAWNATLETIESVGSPKDIAIQFAKDVRGASVPSPNISDEEVGILRDQHLSNKAVDTALADSYALNAKRRAELKQLEAKITKKYNELQHWKHKEYQRVKGNLEDQCKDKLD